MANDIAVIERALDQAMPDIANILQATPGLPAMSFKAALLSQCVRSKIANKILACTTPSLMNCAATFAGLGLMPDGVTGQAFILPFAGIATPVIGYKGYNTLGDRAGRTIDGTVVREGDTFDYELGTRPWVKHKPTSADGRITHAWAVASSLSAPPLVVVMPMTDLLAVMNKSPAVKMKADTPYNDLAVGRPAMFGKTAKRRLARGMPLRHGQQGGYVMADAMESQFDLTGQAHYILPGQDGKLHVTNGVTGAPTDIVPAPDEPIDPTAPIILKAQIESGGKPPQTFDNIMEWKAALLRLVALNAKRKPQLNAIREANQKYFTEAMNYGFEDDVEDVEKAFAKAISA